MKTLESQAGRLSPKENQPSKRLTFDLGSSTLKAVIETANGLETVDHHYKPEIITPDDCPDISLGKNNRFKVVRNGELNKIEQFIENNVPEDLDELDITSAKKPLYGYRKHDDGTYTKILFYDEPSLTIDLSPEEDELIRDRLHLTKQIDQNNPLLKILALKKNPELVRYLYGKDAVFEDLHFGSLATFIRQTVTKEEYPKVGRHYTLAFGMNGCSPSDVVGLVNDLGLNRQLDFETEPIVNVNGVEVTEKDDFRVELDAIYNAVESGTISANRIFIGADSVGKAAVVAENISEGQEWGNFDALKIIKYRIQRTMGNANNWLRPMAEKFCENGTDKSVWVINSVLAESEPTDEWYFDPHANEGDGGLYQKSGAGYIEVKREDLTASRYLMDFDKIVTAVAWGAVSAMRDLLPSDQVMNYDSIAIYGGLVAEYDYGPNDGWRRIFRAVMPKDKRVELLGIPNAGVAMWVVHTMENGGYVDIKTVMPIEPMSGDENDTNGQDLYFDEWKRWQDAYREKILAPAMLGFAALPLAV